MNSHAHQPPPPPPPPGVLLSTLHFSCQHPVPASTLHLHTKTITKDHPLVFHACVLSPRSTFPSHCCGYELSIIYLVVFLFCFCFLSFLSSFLPEFVSLVQWSHLGREIHETASRALEVSRVYFRFPLSATGSRFHCAHVCSQLSLLLSPNVMLGGESR